MNHIERVVTAMSNKEADYVPVYPILCGATRTLVGASYPEWSQNAEVCANAFIKSAEEFDIDTIVTLIDLSVECDAWGQEILYPENEAAHPNYNNMVIQDVEDYPNIKKVDYRNSKRMMMMIDVCKRIVEAKGSELPVVAFVFGPMGTLSMLRNQQDMYMDIYDDPEAVQDAIWQVAETLKEYVEALCDTGVTAIMWDTLFASDSIMSPTMWDEFEGPAMQYLAEAVRAKGKMNMIHNCGHGIYFDEQIKRVDPSAISFLYPAHGCETFAETKEKYGDKVFLIGAVTPATAAIGTDEEWEKECKDCIDAMAAGGGFMLATGCEYPASASLEPARRMIEIAKTYGSYNK